MTEACTPSANARSAALVALADTPTPKAGLSPRESWSGIVSRFDTLARSRAPLRELKAAWSYDLEPCRALTAAICWAKERRVGTLVLSGPVGRGKTVAAARYALSTTAAWCHAPLLALHDWGGAAKRVHALIDAHHLVLDELGGAGTTSGPAVARIASVLSARHAACRPTVVTTNLPQAEFARIYDGTDDLAASRLLDRINDSGSWVFCNREPDPVTQETPGSFRQQGGCNFAHNRYETAQRSLRLLTAVESGDTRNDVLDALQAALNANDDQVRQLQDEALARDRDFAARIDQIAAELRTNATGQGEGA